jgi:hypothetical protein
MTFENIMTLAKQILCALFSLILPFMGIGTIAHGTEKAPAAETVRIMSFNVRDGEF